MPEVVLASGPEAFEDRSRELGFHLSLERTLERGERVVNISFVMTLLGKDQPGIVEAISGVVASHGGSWQDSRLARLSGRFAGFIRISAPESAARDLEQGLLALARKGLDLRIERVDDLEPETEVERVTLDLVGQDRPGILREITAALAAKGVNVIRLDTKCSSAPMSGEILFHAEADLLCPIGLNFESLQQSLERLGQDMMVEVNLAEP
jgi:glycine cleavage system regulatory protein